MERATGLDRDLQWKTQPPRDPPSHLPPMLGSSLAGASPEPEGSSPKCSPRGLALDTEQAECMSGGAGRTWVQAPHQQALGGGGEQIPGKPRRPAWHHCVSGIADEGEDQARITALSPRG